MAKNKPPPISTATIFIPILHVFEFTEAALILIVLLIILLPGRFLEG